jgi:hypothetical protein
MVQSARVRTVGRAEGALELGSTRRFEQTHRLRGRVQDFAVLAEDRELAAFVRSGLRVVRGLEQPASLISGETAVFY